MRARLPQIAFLALALGAPACGASERPPGPEAAQHARVEHLGISLTLPDGWQGRVLPLDYPSAVLQAANFKLTTDERDQPRGGEDPIKAMTAAHVLVSVLPCGLVSFETAPRARPERLALSALMFLPAGHPRVPRGHAFAHSSFLFDDRCLRIEVDFGAARPPNELAQAVDDVLDSLVVAHG
jgi:hypothetical protein